MADRLILHIGTMKSGTSFIQSALMRNDDALADAGLAYLGGSFGKQSRAVRLALGRPPRLDGPRGWGRLAQEARQYDGRAGVVSMEFLSFARDSQVDTFLAPLAGLEVQVVVTVRDQFRAIPAQWQTFVRNFGEDGWETYLRTIDAPRLGRGRDSRAFLTFHRAQDIVPMLQRWSSHPAVGRLDVVTVPGPDAPRDELWNRFCETAGIPVLSTTLDDTQDNSSLGYASCDFLRRLNPHLADVPPRRYRKGIRPLTREVLGPLRQLEGRPELDAKAAAYARSLNEKVRTAVTRQGHRVIGSLDELPVPADLSAYSSTAEAPPVDQVLRAAHATWDHCARLVGPKAGSRPEELDAVVADGARLLRRAKRWNR
ncbi:hypothetical protein NOCA290073 [metagenome]|uniref:Sulfotransferase family protein n=1 Tax=metagenome TaxID=256318 RepID=A0A2P2CGB5_9ZZZZ